MIPQAEVCIEKPHIPEHRNITSRFTETPALPCRQLRKPREQVGFYFWHVLSNQITKQAWAGEPGSACIHTGEDLKYTSVLRAHFFVGFVTTAEVMQNAPVPWALQPAHFPLLGFLGFLLKQKRMTQSFLTGPNDSLLPPSEGLFLGHEFVITKEIPLREYFSL